jgi:succinyl-diaminopimelate desuccinylase
MPTAESDAGPLLRAWIEDHREEVVTGLQRLIRFPTVSGQSDPEEQAAFARAVRGAHRWLIAEADRFGLRTRNHRDWALVIEAGGGEETIAVPLHVDVVPPGEGWRHGDPFSGAVDDGQIWGRGAQDNKGPLTAMLHALAALVALGRPLRRTVRLIIGCGEEIGHWEDVEFVRDHEGEPTLSIVPDCSFPLVVGEKGWLNAVITAGWGSADVGDVPVCLESLVSGDRPNVVPDRAEATLRFDAGAPAREAVDLAASEAHAKCQAEHEGAGIEVEWLDAEDSLCRVTAHGTRAHASSPQSGHSALLDLLGFLVLTFDDLLGAPVHAALRGLWEDCGDVLGGAWGLESEHEFLGPTTVCLTIIRLEGNQIRAVLNIRPTKGVTCAQALAILRRRLERWPCQGLLTLSAAAEGRFFNPQIADTDAIAESLSVLGAAWTEVTGTEPKRLPMAGSTYAKIFPRSVGFGPWWPDVEPGLFHQVDERITVSSQLRNVRLYAEALSRLAL